MNARVADENEEADTEEKLSYAGEVERSRIGEDRHGGKESSGVEGAAPKLLTSPGGLSMDAILGER